MIWALINFGCGTGLFASSFGAAGFRYHGYDVDSRVVSYARQLRAAIRGCSPRCRG
jgi:2-polyprenyl-3-methyl-5-hydroxy-6-metoxy-1,4-benzoquinol methylase